jgi:hypothetical protein
LKFGISLSCPAPGVLARASRGVAPERDDRVSVGYRGRLYALVTKEPRAAPAGAATRKRPRRGDGDARIATLGDGAIMHAWATPAADGPPGEGASEAGAVSLDDGDDCVTFRKDLRVAGDVHVDGRAGQESEIPNFKGSSLGRFPLVSADFWTSDHLSERSRSVDVFLVTRARGTLTLKRR